MKQVRLGLIARPHGLSGAFLLTQDSGAQSNIQKVSSVYLTTDTARGPFRVQKATHMPKGWKVQLADFLTIDSILPFVGAHVCVDRNALPPPNTGEYYAEDLIGLCAIENDAMLGTLSQIESQAVGPDRWWVRLEDGSNLVVPSVSEYVERVDIENGRVYFKNTRKLR